MKIGSVLHVSTRLLAVMLVGGSLAACSSGPSANISLIPVETGDQTGKDGLFTQPISWKHTKPDCEGDCPSLEVDSVVFPGVPRLTLLVDHALAIMTGLDSTGAPPYSTIKEFEAHFWKTAAPRDSTMLSARTRYRNKELTVVELNTWQYFTGSAHGISATQFLNWHNDSGRVLALTDVLQPGRYDAYIQALKTVHGQWLASHPDALNDPETFTRIWPFQPNENFAFTDGGLVVKYDSYQIAPYSSGQPELLIPYAALKDVLRPEFVPA